MPLNFPLLELNGWLPEMWMTKNFGFLLYILIIFGCCTPQLLLKMCFCGFLHAFMRFWCENDEKWGKIEFFKAYSQTLLHTKKLVEKKFFYAYLDIFGVFTILFFDGKILKQQKILFYPANGVPSTCLLVKVRNNCGL